MITKSTNQINVSVVMDSETNNVAEYYYSLNNSSYEYSTNSNYTFSPITNGIEYTIKVYVFKRKLYFCINNLKSPNHTCLKVSFISYSLFCSWTC